VKAIQLLDKLTSEDGGTNPSFDVVALEFSSLLAPSDHVARKRQALRKIWYADASLQKRNMGLTFGFEVTNPAPRSEVDLSG
jgi:hypothetical protein